tara:strand:- start:1107 stop:1841 length:735 start_codon:yes stop_codon:yes gene_type:complete
MIILKAWYGRLGNNIIQLSNIIDITIAYKHNIKFNVKKLNFFDLSVIEKYFSKYNNNEIITDKYNFYYSSRLLFSNDIFKQNIEERNKILQKAFLINNINKLPENDIVIHIRSGDIFSSNPHPNYVPPPLSYYTKEIDKYKYEKIHIICEDTINPVVNELLKLYKNAVYEKNTLEKDIRIILGATNIIYSVGTFIPALMLLSNNNKYLYGKEFNNEELKEYYKIMKPWKNTIEQRNYILTYDYN